MKTPNWKKTEYTGLGHKNATINPMNAGIGINACTDKNNDGMYNIPIIIDLANRTTLVSPFNLLQAYLRITSARTMYPRTKIRMLMSTPLAYNAPSRGVYERFSASKIPADLAC